MKQPVRTQCAAQVRTALTVMFFAIPVFAQAQQATDLGAVGATGAATGAGTAVAAAPVAAQVAPIRTDLDARSAQSSVSNEFIRNFISPVSDYSQVLQMAPGMFSYSPNGVGLGDAKVTMRGYSDSNSVIAFDGIPFNDTNGVSHHSWVFFPSQFLGGAVIDRSPGSAATIGQATFGGSINLLSREMEPVRRDSVTLSGGSWNTKLLGYEHETGQFGADGAHNILFNVQKMQSDGYQTHNAQDREAFSLKYQYAVSADTAITAFTSYLNLKTNTPNVKGVTRANVNAGNYNTLLSGDPTSPLYFGYNFYKITTDFNYIGVTSNLGNGWKLDNKAYVYRYWNKQNYNSSTAIAYNSATDKLNSYVTYGNTLRLSKDFDIGTLRTGLWMDAAHSYRFQIPNNPLTGVDVAVPNFSERYKTTTLQPYVEFELHVTPALKITPGVKFALYQQDFNHLQDNGGAVGPLGGKLVYSGTTKTAVNVVGITGGAPSINNAVTYRDVLPSLDLHYQLRPNWSAYAQFAQGDAIPSTSVFDTVNAQVAVVPKPTKSKTFQVGTVWQGERFTLGVDLYHVKLDNAYSTYTDSLGNVVYTLQGNQINQGIEAESTVLLGHGMSLYGNATYGSAKYDTGQWVSEAPKDTQTLGLNYKKTAWDIGLFAKRVGRLYAAQGTNTQGAAVDPNIITNLFVNYTLKNISAGIKTARMQFGVNNLFNKHNVVDVASFANKTGGPNAADLLTVLPERSVSATVTFDF